MLLKHFLLVENLIKWEIRVGSNICFTKCDFLVLWYAVVGLITENIIMHPCPPGKHIAIDSYLFILSFELKTFAGKHVSIIIMLRGFRNPVCLSVPRDKKSPFFRQYQSNISNWYINGKVFTSTTAWKHKNFILFSTKVEFEFWLVPNCWNQLSFVNISPPVVIGTWLERFSRVLLQHWNPKNYCLFKKCLP